MLLSIWASIPPVELFTFSAKNRLSWILYVLFIEKAHGKELLFLILDCFRIVTFNFKT